MRRRDPSWTSCGSLIRSAKSLFFCSLLVAIGLASTLEAAEQYAVFRSEDRGQSWIRSDAGMPGNVRVNGFAAQSTNLIAATDSGIYVSRNEGKKWEAASGMATSPVRTLGVVTLGTDVFAAADRNGILKSSNLGRSWTLKAELKDIRCLLAHDGKLYAGTDAGGVWISSDVGESWARTEKGLPPEAQVSTLAAIGPYLFAGLYSQGLYRWDKAEQRWARAGPVLPLVLTTIDGVIIAGHNPGGIHRSDDLGATWTRGIARPSLGELGSALSEGAHEFPVEAPVWEAGSGDGLVFAGAASGIFYSEDQGRTWAKAVQGLPEKSPGISFLVREKFVLAGTVLGGMQGTKKCENPHIGDQR